MNALLGKLLSGVAYLKKVPSSMLRSNSVPISLFLGTLIAVTMFSVCSSTYGCEPDTVNWTPTPTVMWDSAPYADGFGLYMRTDGGPWYWLADLACWHVDDDGVWINGCYGVNIEVPLQRYLTDSELLDVEFAVDAYNQYGRSEGMSNTIFVCMPNIWEPGKTYE